MALTHALPTNNYGAAKLIVATSAANGTHTTLAAAMADAISGDTIFLRDSVTENVTLTPGVNIAAWTGGTLNTPSITGKLTMTGAGTCNISGLKLVTNSDFLLAVTGSANSVVNLNNCFLSITNNTGISFTTSGASSGISLNYCSGDITTTGISCFSHSSAGGLTFTYCVITNNGQSTTASTCSAGSVSLRNSRIGFTITTSSTASFVSDYTFHESPAINLTMLTLNGTGSVQRILKSYVGSGTSSAISIGSGVTVIGTGITLNTSNANAITGAGTLNYSLIDSVSGTALAMNVTGTTAYNAMMGSVSFDAGANYLSNYAVGTWTPTITPSGTAFTSITYSNQTGFYTRIGNMVTIWGSVSVSALTIGSATGSLRISALPFTSNSAANVTYSGVLGASNVTFTGINYLYGALSPSSTNVNVQTVKTAGAITNLGVANLASNSAFNLCLSYRV